MEDHQQDKKESMDYVDLQQEEKDVKEYNLGSRSKKDEL